MEDAHVVPSSENGAKKGSGLKIVLFSFLGILLVALAAGGSYYLGRQSVQGAKTESVPYTSLADELNKRISSLSPTPEAVVTQEASPSGQKVSPTPLGKSLTLTLDKTRSGTRSSTESAQIIEGLSVGSNKDNVYRAFLTFNLNSLREGITIQKAILRIYLDNTEGSPLSVSKTIKIDHLTYGDTLDQSDYSMAALSSGFSDVTKDGKPEWKEVDVTASIIQDITNARSYSQFRLHGATERKTESNNFVNFKMIAPELPQLVLSYN
jgi:hypothetical protein